MTSSKNADTKTGRLKIGNPIDLLQSRVGDQLKREKFQRDPQFLESAVPYLDKVAAYFDAEMRGMERLPEKGPMLLVSNHSGACLTPDSMVFMWGWLKARGFDDPLSILGFDILFAVPKVGDAARRGGAMPASMAAGQEAFNRGSSVLVYPGGEWELYRPWAERNRIDFNQRKGFIRLALEKGVPVVPLVAHGGHDTRIILTRGERAAEPFGLKRYRLAGMPITWGLCGPGLGWVPSVPYPAKIVIEALEPLDWSSYGPRSASNPEVLETCYEEITDVMQSCLDRLSEEIPYPVASRIGKGIRDSATSAWEASVPSAWWSAAKGATKKAKKGSAKKAAKKKVTKKKAAKKTTKKAARKVSKKAARKKTPAPRT